MTELPFTTENQRVCNVCVTGTINNKTLYQNHQRHTKGTGNEGAKSHYLENWQGSLETLILLQYSFVLKIQIKYSYTIKIL